MHSFSECECTTCKITDTSLSACIDFAGTSCFLSAPSCATRKHLEKSSMYESGWEIQIYLDCRSCPDQMIPAGTQYGLRLDELFENKPSPRSSTGAISWSVLNVDQRRCVQAARRQQAAASSYPLAERKTGKVSAVSLRCVMRRRLRHAQLDCPARRMHAARRRLADT
eukprot:2190645-Pleurochrysis_carterae.AAC.1